MRLLEAPNDAELDQLKADCAQLYGRSVADVRVIRSPYRICPLGAHIDHQLGPVSAIAVNQGIALAFVVNDVPRIELISRGYPGTVSFDFDRVQERAHDWADYARGAVNALRGRGSLTRGVSIVVQGHLGECGISSSAAVGLGYLLALAVANGLALTPAELIDLDRAIENDFMGLRNGVLDPSAIALAEEGRLTVVDCVNLTTRHVPQDEPFVFLAVFSGVKEALVASGRFNNRVEECLRAGSMLWERVHGHPHEPLPLGRISPADWRLHGAALREPWRRRAAHFYGESQRVLQGAEAWAAGDPARFGRLMTESGRSSIDNYETGSPEMIRLYEVLNEAPGVWGARFSGAGFRGCAVALVDPAQIADILAHVEARYLHAFPHFAERLWAFATSAGPGLRLL